MYIDHTLFLLSIYYFFIIYLLLFYYLIRIFFFFLLETCPFENVLEFKIYVSSGKKVDLGQKFIEVIFIVRTFNF